MWQDLIPWYWFNTQTEIEFGLLKRRGFVYIMIYCASSLVRMPWIWFLTFYSVLAGDVFQLRPYGGKCYALDFISPFFPAPMIILSTCLHICCWLCVWEIWIYVLMMIELFWQAWGFLELMWPDLFPVAMTSTSWMFGTHIFNLALVLWSLQRLLG